MKIYFFHTLLGLVHKDLRLELRGGETISSILMLGVTLLVVFYFSLGEGLAASPSVAIGVFWVALLFGCVLGQGRTFIVERDAGCLTALLLAPADRSAIYLAKVLVNFIFLMVVELILVPLFLVLYGVAFVDQPFLALSLLLAASVGLTVVGTLVSSLGLSSRNRELLLPILVFPLLLPVLIAAVEGSVSLLPGSQGEPPWTWLRLLIGYDIVFLAVAILLFDFALGE